MSLPTILSLVDPEHGAATLKLTALAAKTLGASVDVIVVKPDPRDAIPAIGEAMTGDLVAQVMAQAEEAGNERAAVAKTLFQSADLTSATFVEATGRDASVIAREARARAMTVLPSGGIESGDTPAISAALFETGRPALIAPLHQATSVGKRVAIFWKDSQEAAKAVWGAVPFLRQAETVKIFTVGDDLAAANGLERLQAGLARAGVEAEAQLIEPDHRPDSELLVDAAADMDADLVVMGAYSHSRISEIVFGGVTRDMLNNLARPVFMAH